MNDFDDTTLTEDEEIRFNELFSPSDRLTLTHDWKRALHEAILKEDSGLSVTVTDNDADASNVISLDERRRLRDAAPRLLVAAALAAIVGFAMISVVGQGPGDVVNVPVLAPEREIGPPTFDRLGLPDDIVTTVATNDGVLAIAQDPTTGESTIFTSSNGNNWIERSTLAVRNAAVDVTGDSWIVAGEDLATAMPVTNAPGESLAINISVLRSRDGGDTWVEIPFVPEVHERPGVANSVTDVTVAQIDDTVLIGYLQVPVFDSTALFVENNVIGPDDRVIRVFDENNDEVLFSVGPDVFGELDVLPSDVGMTRDEFNETVVLPVWAAEPMLALSDNGVAFETVEYPNDTTGLAPQLAVFDDSFVVLLLTGSGGYTPSVSLATYKSLDGREWEQVNSSDVLQTSETLSDSWIVRSGDDGIPRQSVDGGRRFAPIPTPRAGLVAISVVPTDFGSAVVWLDINQLVVVDGSATIEQDGYTIVLEGDRVVVTDPGGTEIADQSMFENADGPVVTGSRGEVLIVDDEGNIVLAVHGTSANVSSDLGDTSPEQFIGWSTDGTDWKFASLDDIGPGLWTHYATNAGLVAIETLDYDDAVIFEWPAEFIER